jgi:hypothetical protein
MAHHVYHTPAAREILAGRSPAIGANPYVFTSDSTQGETGAAGVGPALNFKYLITHPDPRTGRACAVHRHHRAARQRRSSSNDIPEDHADVGLGWWSDLLIVEQLAASISPKL